MSSSFTSHAIAASLSHLKSITHCGVDVALPCSSVLAADFWDSCRLVGNMGVGRVGGRISNMSVFPVLETSERRISPQLVCLLCELSNDLRCLE